MAGEIISGSDKNIEAQQFDIIDSPRYSCALGGAYAAVLDIYHGIPILHSGGGCSLIHLNGFRASSGNQGVGYIGGNNTPCTFLLEKEVVFGGENKLREEIKSTIELLNGDLFVIINGCIPAMVGDDVASVVNEFKDAPGSPPLVYVDTAGFKGNSYKGYELLLDAFIEQLLVAAPKKHTSLVNILGIAPTQHVFWKGDLIEIRELFKKLGLTANILFGDFDGVDAIKRIPSAELSVVFSPWLGIDAARKLEDKFGVPYITFPGIPVGPKETIKFVRQLGDALHIPKKKLDKLIKDEAREAYRLFDVTSDLTTIGQMGTNFALVSDSNMGIGIYRFLVNEFGQNPEIVIITDNPPVEYRDIIIKCFTEDIESLGKPDVYFETDAYKISQILKKYSFVSIYGSTIEKSRYRHLQSLSISYPVNDRIIADRSYFGFKGGLALSEDRAGIIMRPGLY